MFKQINIMFIFTFISYFLTKYILKKNYRRFYFINGIIKYPLKCKIKNAINISFLDLKELENVIFYTKDKINCNNYIYDILNDYYYLIEPGYYYYIKNKDNIKLKLENYTTIFYIKVKC